jgi:hypothetical protein
LPWLADNQDALGFGALTAQRLIKASNTSSTTHLTEDEAIQISRGGKEPEPEP